VANACVGYGFVINGDGSLGLAGPRSGSWPYGSSGACAVGNANGLRVDTTTGNLWVEPPDIRTSSQLSFTGSSATSSTSWQDFGFASQNFTNADTCRPAILYGEALITWTVSTIPAGSGISIAADVYTTTPGSPGTQTLRYYQPNMTGVGTADINTLTIPFLITVAAGATQTVWMSAAHKLDSGTAGFSTPSLRWTAEVLTSRASW